MRPSYELTPDDRADESLRKILHHLHDAISSNVDGVIDDEGVEFLHDLRVANRRTRTVLSQIKGVLESSVVERFSPEFKWLGVVSGPCRDLDVTLLELHILRERIGIREDELDSFHRFLSDMRTTEHNLLVEALRSPRLSQLLEGWNACLSSEVTEEGQPLASSPIIEVASPRILKAFNRIRKRGEGVDSEATAELLHRLRIDGKKLRYLLEFFSGLYPARTVTRCIKQLKRIQNVLGEFSDTEVQLALIGEFEKESSTSAVSTDRTSQLRDAIGTRRSELRTEIVDRLRYFVGSDNRRRYRKTFNNR
jgi:CHAD domain-containing protein